MWKKRKWSRQMKLRIMAIVVICAVFAGTILYFDKRITELNNQLTYLMDTNSTIQGNVADLQSNIQATLEKEASLVADYVIEPTGIDLVKKIYSVRIQVVPKEYTDETKVSVYFGSREYLLELGENGYVGKAILPISESYDGNVTILLTNGNKKSTEVLKDYVGYPHVFEKVLSGGLEKFPEYEDGKLKIPGKTSFKLDGKQTFEFTSLDLVVNTGNTEYYRANLLTNEVLEKAASNETDGEDAQSSGADDNLANENLAEPDNNDPISDIQSAINSMVGAEDNTEEKEEPQMLTDSITGIKGEYEVKDELEVAQQTEIKIRIEAKTVDDFVFSYVIFDGTTNPADPEKPEEHVDGWQPSEDYLPYTYTVIDKKGGVWNPDK